MVAGDDHQRRDERLLVTGLLQRNDDVLDHRSVLDGADEEATVGDLVQSDLKLTVHGVGDVMRRAVPHQHDGGILVGKFLESLHEDLRHLVAAFDAGKERLAEAQILDAVFAFQFAPSLDHVFDLVVFGAGDDVRRHHADFGEALVVQLRQGHDGRGRDVLLAFAGQLAADDVGSERQTHFGAGERLFGGGHQIVDGFAGAGHGSAERGDQDCLLLFLFGFLGAGDSGESDGREGDGEDHGLKGHVHQTTFHEIFSEAQASGDKKRHDPASCPSAAAVTGQPPRSSPTQTFPLCKLPQRIFWLLFILVRVFPITRSVTCFGFVRVTAAGPRRIFTGFLFEKGVSCSIVIIITRTRSRFNET